MVLEGAARPAGGALTSVATEPKPIAAAMAGEPHPVWRAILLSVGALLGANLIGVALAGALGQAGIGGYIGAAWPAELFVVVLALSLIMEATAQPWLAVAVTLTGSVGLLLDYYAVSRQWQNWFWWPLLVLLVAAEWVWTARWMRAAPPTRARQLGRWATRASVVLIVLSLALAIVAARR